MPHITERERQIAEYAEYVGRQTGRRITEQTLAAAVFGWRGETYAMNNATCTIDGNTFDCHFNFAPAEPPPRKKPHADFEVDPLADRLDVPIAGLLENRDVPAE